MATQSKQKKVKGVRQKVKLFRANEPLKSVLMWSVNYSFSQLNHVKPRAMMLANDFEAYLKVKVNNHVFNKDNMPSHFKFKEYCPLVFQNLRDRFNIDKNDFWDSFTKSQPIWDNCRGRSGSKFLLTYNKHYIVKTITAEEVMQMHQMLQSYHEYIVNSFGKTCLPQFLAMYRLTVSDQETYLLIMRNIFSPRLPIHKKYDLKGSTIDREATEKEKKNNAVPTLKDVDFVNDNYKIDIGATEKERIMKVLQADVEFLQANHLMDYSLIVGVHDPERQDEAEQVEDPGLSPYEEEDDSGGEAAGDMGVSGRRGSHPPVEYRNLTPPDSPTNLHFSTAPFMGELHPFYEYYGIKSSPKAEMPVIYFLGIIDILTVYGMRKRTAQTYKTVKHGANADISTVKPDNYAKRFLEFVGQCIE